MEVKGAGKGDILSGCLGCPGIVVGVGVSKLNMGAGSVVAGQVGGG